MSMASSWKIYRTRFLIKARQLDAPLTFTDPLGREHSGQKGDYLVESADGLQRIAPREIFEDIYVPMAEVREPNVGLRTPVSARSNPNSQTSLRRLPDSTSFGGAPDSQPSCSSSVRSKPRTRRTEGACPALNQALAANLIRRFRGEIA